jgi:hypothetical protein
MEYLTKQNVMLVLLGLAFLSIIFAFWRAHKLRTDFDIVDLVMQDGKISRIGTAFMLTLLVSSWVIINKQMKGELDSTTFSLWMAAWVGPLVARVVTNSFSTKPAVDETTAGKGD